MDSIGRRISSGSKLRLAFGRVGSLVAKERTLGFVFAEGFRSPKENPAVNKYDGDVRRIMAAIEAKAKCKPAASSPCSGRATTTRPETCSPPPSVVSTTREPTAGSGLVRTRSVKTLCKERNATSRSSQSGTDPNALFISVRSSNAGGGVSRSVLAETGSGSGLASRPRRQRASADRSALPEEPTSPNLAPMIAGAAAMVAGGPKRQDKKATATQGVAAFDDRAAVAADMGALGQEDQDVSPRTAKKVLPHFLAIGNPGSQALVAKDGAGIVQKQAREARERFAKVKAANLHLDEKELEETKKRQASGAQDSE
ncbi:unnamed protein product [Hapterophycus canaliculatus]